MNIATPAATPNTATPPRIFALMFADLGSSQTQTACQLSKPSSLVGVIAAAATARILGFATGAQLDLPLANAHVKASLGEDCRTFLDTSVREAETRAVPR